MAALDVYGMLGAALARIDNDGADPGQIRAVLTVAGVNGGPAFEIICRRLASLLVEMPGSPYTDAKLDTEGRVVVPEVVATAGSHLFPSADDVVAAINTEQGRCQVIELLASEVLVSRALSPDIEVATASTSAGRVVTAAEALELPPGSSMMDMVAATKALTAATKEDWRGNPLFNVDFTTKQEEVIEGTMARLQQEYTMRRVMLRKRLDVVVQSLLWSDLAKKNMDILMAAYRPRRDAIEEDHNISLYDVRTATDQLLILEQITSGAASKNTGSAVKKILIGAVPDRGGRANMDSGPQLKKRNGPGFKQQMKNKSGGGGGNRNKKRKGQSNRRGNEQQKLKQQAS